jgi:8-oxo-dGTP diphosphatase
MAMPKTTVAALITATTDGEERVLLTQRDVMPFKGQWCLPGGHIDQYENARDAVVREVAEETGLAFEASFFAYFDEIIPEREIHAVVLVFTGRASGTISAQPGEVSAIGWFSLAEAQALPLAFKHNEIVSAYARAGADRRWQVRDR